MISEFDTNVRIGEPEPPWSWGFVRLRIDRNHFQENVVAQLHQVIVRTHGGMLTTLGYHDAEMFFDVRNTLLKRSGTDDNMIEIRFQAC